MAGFNATLMAAVACAAWKMGNDLRERQRQRVGVAGGGGGGGDMDAPVAAMYKRLLFFCKSSACAVIAAAFVLAVADVDVKEEWSAFIVTLKQRGYELLRDFYNFYVAFLDRDAPSMESIIDDSVDYAIGHQIVRAGIYTVILFIEAYLPHVRGVAVFVIDFADPYVSRRKIPGLAEAWVCQQLLHAAKTIITWLLCFFIPHNSVDRLFAAGYSFYGIFRPLLVDSAIVSFPFVLALFLLQELARFAVEWAFWYDDDMVLPH